MPAGKPDPIQIDPITRLYRVKQLISFPGISEILFLFRRTQEKEEPVSDEPQSGLADSVAKKSRVKAKSAGQQLE